MKQANLLLCLCEIQAMYCDCSYHSMNKCKRHKENCESSSVSEPEEGSTVNTAGAATRHVSSPSHLPLHVAFAAPNGSNGPTYMEFCGICCISCAGPTLAVLLVNISNHTECWAYLHQAFQHHHWLSISFLQGLPIAKWSKGDACGSLCSTRSEVFKQVESYCLGETSEEFGENQKEVREA